MHARYAQQLGAATGCGIVCCRFGTKWGNICYAAACARSSGAKGTTAGGFGLRSKSGGTRCTKKPRKGRVCPRTCAAWETKRNSRSAAAAPPRGMRSFPHVALPLCLSLEGTADSVNGMVLWAPVCVAAVLSVCVGVLFPRAPTWQVRARNKTGTTKQVNDQTTTSSEQRAVKSLTLRVGLQQRPSPAGCRLLAVAC